MTVPEQDAPNYALQCIMSSHVFLVSVLLPFLLFLGRTYSNHMYVGSSLKFGHITRRIFTASESLFMSTDGVFGSRSAVTSYLDIVFDWALNNSAEFLSNDPLSASFGWDLHKNGMLHDGRLNSPITSFFYGSSNQAMWNLHIVASLDTEWEISQEFLLPSTQLITKCKRRAKLNGKIKRSKLSHLYYSNSVVTDRLVLAGDVETNPGPNDAKTGRKKSVQNIAVKKSCLACNKTIRLNQKELTCNLCSGSFHYKCEAGKLKLDVNLWNCTRCGLPPLSDSFFDLDTELNRSRRSSQ